MSIRCAVLDFGNVVAFFDHRKACRQLAELSRPSRDAAQVHQAIFETPLETDYDTGRISTATFLQVLRDDLGVQASDAEIGRAWADIFTLNPSMGAVIGELDTKGLRLVLASNTNAL